MKKLFIILIVCLGFANIQAKKLEKQAAEQVQLSGAWKLITSDLIPNFSDSSPLGAIKMFSAGHFNASIYHKETGELLSCNSGTYTTSGNNYVEKVIFSNIPEMVNTESNYSIRLEGNRIYIEGTVRDGKAKLKEIWEKIQE